MKFELSAYFEETLYDVDHRMNNLGNALGRFREAYRFHFISDQSSGGRSLGIIPRDYNALKNNNQFITALERIANNRLAISNLLIGCKEESEELNQKLEAYLEDE